MDASVVAVIASGVFSIIVAALGLLGKKKGTLAQAEHNFRETIINENKRLRARVNELEDSEMDLRKRLLNLEAIILREGIAIEKEKDES